jgi:hypothetical protein
MLPITESYQALKLWLIKNGGNLLFQIISIKYFINLSSLLKH